MNVRADESFERLRQSADEALKIGRSWEKKGNLVWACRCHESAARLTLAIAVGKYADAAGAKHYLAERSMVPLLEKVSGLQQWMLEEVEVGRVPADEFSGNYICLAFSHLCCVLENFALAKNFAYRAFSSAVLSTSTNFWYDYARGYRCLWEQQPYKKGTFPSLRLAEQYWVPYMDLMEAISSGRSLDEAVVATDESFRKRNQDNRMKDDAYMLDGSAYIPVRWNFRRDGLLSLRGHFKTVGAVDA